MITASGSAVEILQDQLLDWCSRKFAGLDKTRKQLLDWCFEKGIGFTAVSIANEAGKMVPTLALGWVKQGDEAVTLGGMKVFLGQASVATVGGCQLPYSDEPPGGFASGDAWQVVGRQS